ncbi:hypothetical protein FDENT_8152 [Fusarium denticulatum]|uniref:Uncharacterized protein n=1 Tax=Fusarium denticulatum TaxID=48507 RepID=A0A8H5U3N7_9HYPO|nr:hypothetical protein FDENT_8152 [Fusarium denticulatum]
MSSPESSAPDATTLRLRYVDARTKGRELMEKLQSGDLDNKTYTPFDVNYRLDYIEVSQKRLETLTASKDKILRPYDIEKNRLAGGEVYSLIPSSTGAYVVSAPSDCNSGILELREAKRTPNDQTQWQHQLPISELL